MSSPLRTAVLFLAPVLGLTALFFFSSFRDAPKPAATLEEPSVSEHVRTPPEPSKPALPAPVVPQLAQAAAATASAFAERPTADSLAAEMHSLEDLDPERALEI